MRTFRITVFSVLAIIVVLASVCVIVFGIISGSENENPQTSMLFFDAGMYIAYALLILAVVAAFVFPLVSVLRNLAKSKRTLIGVGAFILIFFLIYLLSPSFSGDFYTRNGIGPAESRFINAGIISVYIFLLVTLVVLVYDEIARRIR
jgi:uncharacterized membrane protein YozB (DUF420 family)